ncbi:unnamed protein product, partial [Agarophyton chilense]
HPVVVVWFRRDLRLHDNACVADLHHAVVAPLLLLPSSPPPLLLAAARDLRAALRARGAELYVRHATHDAPAVATAVRRFCEHVRADYLHVAADVRREARVAELRVRREVAALGVRTVAFWSDGLLSPEQLPFSVQDMPDDCDAFADAVRHVRIAEPLPAPLRLRGVRARVSPGHIPPNCCQYADDDGRRRDDEQREDEERGGEREALQRLQEYCSGALARVQKGRLHTSFGRLGPFLELGCVSARLLWWRAVAPAQRTVRRYCAEFELMLREFSRFDSLRRLPQ